MFIRLSVCLALACIVIIRCTLAWIKFMVGYSNVMENLTQKHVHLFNRLFQVPPCLKRDRVWMCKLSVISQEQLKIKVKLILSAYSKSCNYATSIGTTTDDFEWPWMTASRIARYLCGSWPFCMWWLVVGATVTRLLKFKELKCALIPIHIVST